MTIQDDYSLAQLLDPRGEPVLLRAQDVAALYYSDADRMRHAIL